MKLLSLDCETTIVDLGRGKKCRDEFNVPELVCVQFARMEGKTPHGWVWEWNLPDLDADLHLELENPEALWVGHNIPFDILVLCKAFPSLEPLWRRAVAENRVLDTMVLAHLREPCIKRKNLAALAKVYLKKELQGKDDIRLGFSRTRPLTPAQREYALEDAKMTLKLAEHFRTLRLGSIYRGRVMPRFNMECQENHHLPPGRGGFHPLDHVYSSCFINTRCWSEPLGWDLDMEKFEAHRAACQVTIEERARELHTYELIRRVRDTTAPVAEVEGPPGPAKKWTYDPDRDQFVRYLKKYSRWEVQPARWQLHEFSVRDRLAALARDLELEDAPLSAKTYQISMTYDYWKLYQEHMDPGLQAFMAYARAQKYESIYFKIWAQSKTRRVYPTYYIPGTETLRHAAGKPNLHQIAKSLREIFYVKDHVIVGADYSALECYTLCHVLCNLGLRGPLFETLSAGGDLHSLTASRMLGGRPGDYGKGTKERQAAKALNFGIPGGLGIKKMYSYGRQSYGLDWTKQEAADLYCAWLDAYTDVKEYLEHFRKLKPWQLKRKTQTLEQWLSGLGFAGWPQGGVWDITERLDKGRLYDVQLPTGARLPARNYTQGTNCAFQHVGAVATSHAINLCFAAGLPVIAAVHDAVYLASPPGPQSHVHAHQLEILMEQALHEVCPLAPRQRVEAEIHETFF